MFTNNQQLNTFTSSVWKHRLNSRHHRQHYPNQLQLQRHQHHILLPLSIHIFCLLLFSLSCISLTCDSVIVMKNLVIIYALQCASMCIFFVLFQHHVKTGETKKKSSFKTVETPIDTFQVYASGIFNPDEVAAQFRNRSKHCCIDHLVVVAEVVNTCIQIKCVFGSERRKKTVENKRGKNNRYGSNRKKDG